MISRTTEIKIQKIGNLIALFLAFAIIGSTVAWLFITAGMKKHNKEYLIEVERIYQTYESRVE